MKPGSSTQNTIGNEQGMALITALMILQILVIIGVVATTNTALELQIAGYDKAAKKTFYNADGGTELASEAVEHNAACINFAESRTHGIYAYTLNFSQNPTPANPTQPEAGNRDFCYPGDCNATNTQVTSVSTGSRTITGRGGAIQQLAGYEGKGKGVAGSTAYLLFDIYSRHQGLTNSDATIHTEWRHNIGQEGDCPLAY